MKAGDLARMKGQSALWLVLDINNFDVLVVSLKTNYKMWGNKEAYEVISETR